MAWAAEHASGALSEAAPGPHEAGAAAELQVTTTQTFTVTATSSGFAGPVSGPTKPVPTGR